MVTLISPGVQRSRPSIDGRGGGAPHSGANSHFPTWYGRGPPRPASGDSGWRRSGGAGHWRATRLRSSMIFLRIKVPVAKSHWLPRLEWCQAWMRWSAFAAQTAFVNVDGLGLCVFLGPVPGNKTGLAVAAVDLQRPLTAETVGKHEVGLRVLSLSPGHQGRE